MPQQRVNGETPEVKGPPRNCRPSCFTEINCRPECYHKKQPCKQNCCDRLTLRRYQARQARANSSVMQKQLASALTMVVPKYARRPKPTPGKGHGCGAPGCQRVPPLWMYSMGKKKCLETAPPRPIGKLRSYKTYRKSDKKPFNHPDELGTHRYYLPH